MATSDLKLNELSRDEFIELAGQSKVTLLEMLAAEMFVVGYQAARAQANFYRAKILEPDNRPKLAEATALRNELDVKYDALKHTTSALQSALKVERIGLYPNANDQS